MTAAGARVDGAAAASRPDRGGLRTDTPTVRTHDFRTRPALSPEAVEALDRCAASFAAHCSDQMVPSLRVPGPVTVVGTIHDRLAAVLRPLPGPAVLCVLDALPLEQPAVVVVGRHDAHRLVDRMLGGPGGTGQADRPLSGVDRRLLAELVGRCLGGMPPSYGLLGLIAVDLVDVRELDPIVTSGADEPLPVDDVLAHRLQLDMDGQPLDLDLCLPALPLAERLRAPGAGARPNAPRPDPGFATRMVRALQPVPVEVAVEFRATAISPDALLSLTVGDVVPLDHPTNVPLALTAGGAVVAHAVPGAEGGRLAVLVVDPEGREAAPC